MESFKTKKMTTWNRTEDGVEERKKDTDDAAAATAPCRGRVPSIFTGPPPVDRESIAMKKSHRFFPSQEDL